jgi:hypothetical protein
VSVCPHLQRRHAINGWRILGRGRSPT